MNYKTYIFSPQELFLYCAEGILIAAAAAFVFYRSVVAFLLLLPLLPLFLSYIKKVLIRRRRYELMLEFREAIMAVQAALNAGYSIENAFVEAARDMENMYGRDGLITAELMVLSRRLRSNENLEKILYELAERSGVEDITDFSNVFTAAKRSGGDMSRIIRRASDTIGDKIDVRRDIETIMSSKRFENRIMELVPFGMILYIGLTSPDFIAVLYHNAAGEIVMTVCLVLYALGLILSERIVNIEI